MATATSNNLPVPHDGPEPPPPSLPRMLVHEGLKLPATVVAELNRLPCLSEWTPESDWIYSETELARAKEVLVAAREQIFRPASPEIVFWYVSVLIETWPQPQPEAKGYTLGLLQECVYPDGVLDEALSAARRKFEWLPSIASFVALCEDRLEERRRFIATKSHRLVFDRRDWLESQENLRRRAENMLELARDRTKLRDTPEDKWDDTDQMLAIVYENRGISGHCFPIGVTPTIDDVGFGIATVIRRSPDKSRFSVADAVLKQLDVATPDVWERLMKAAEEGRAGELQLPWAIVERD